MGYTVFFGTSGVGKTLITLCTAKILANSGKKILVVESMKKSNLFYYFNIKRILVQSKGTVEVNGFDVVINYPFMEGMDLSKIEAFLTDYDEVLVIADDDNINFEIIHNADNRFLVQDFNQMNLYKNKEFLDRLLKDREKTDFNIIYNRCLKSKIKISYLEKYLDLSGGKRISIPFRLEDMVADTNNRLDNKISLEKFSIDHNVAIFDIANLIVKEELQADKKTFKKLIANK